MPLPARTASTPIWDGAALDAVPSLSYQSVNIEALRRRRRLFWITGAFVALALIGAGVGILASQMPFADDLASIEVESVPRGARVMIDGKPVGNTTPVKLSGVDTTKEHVIEVHLPTYEAWKNQIRFPAGHRHIRALAVLTPELGKLELTSVPSGAEIFLNGRPYGRTPTTIDQLSLRVDPTISLRLKGRELTRTFKWRGRSYLKQHVIIE
jgi:hypothetical protein